MLSFPDALRKLERLRQLVDEYNPIKYESGEKTKALAVEIPQLYGEVEDMYKRHGGAQRVEFDDRGHKMVYPNFFEAGYLSGRSFHDTEGYRELLKVIGRVRQEASTAQARPAEPEDDFNGLVEQGSSLVDASNDPVRVHSEHERWSNAVRRWLTKADPRLAAKWASFGLSGLVEGGSYYDDLVAWAKFSDLVRYQLRWLADNGPHTSSSAPPGKVEPLPDVGKILRRFRQCCQYVTTPPSSEREVQDVVWIMLRAHFDQLDREDTLPRFGVKNYVPDFGIPQLKLLVEVKFVGPLTKLAHIQEELLADVPGYLQEGGRYDRMLAFVYDSAHKLKDNRKFKDDLLKSPGVSDVIVIPGIG